MYRLGVNGYHDALIAEAFGGLAHELGSGDGGGIDGHLVGAGVQHPSHIVQRADAAAHGQGDCLLYTSRCV